MLIHVQAPVLATYIIMNFDHLVYLLAVTYDIICQNFEQIRVDLMHLHKELKRNKHNIELYTECTETQTCLWDVVS